MRRLGKIVSIVPVIAKADTLTLEERLEFKQRVSCPSSTPVQILSYAGTIGSPSIFPAHT